MKTGLSKVTHLFTSHRIEGYRKVKTSTNNGKHPYLRSDFWANPLNQFWNSDLYSEASKEQLKNSISV